MTVSKQTIPVVVGSRSPRRLELLQAIVDPERLVVLPPENSDEPGFDDLMEMVDFETRILEIVDAKMQDVISQIQRGSESVMFNRGCVILCADTTVVVEDANGNPLALGQPPENDEWPNDVRKWFRDYFAGKMHTVLSGVAVTLLDETTSVKRSVSATCRSLVTMREDIEHLLDWYISTGEPIGKAGGYAIQGAGSVFVTKFEGSFSNVVGLPLEETLELLRNLNVLK